MELYKTVRKEGEAIQVIEKSRFIGHVRSVESRSEADEFIASVKAEYKDANHNVPAIVIGDKAQIQWASDDGEPQGTSGAPMVQMMVKEGLTNLAVVVTRYFGGIKLGTGGLVRAYTGTAKKSDRGCRSMRRIRCGAHEGEDGIYIPVKAAEPGGTFSFRGRGRIRHKRYGVRRKSHCRDRDFP